MMPAPGGDPESELVGEFRRLAGASLAADSRLFEFHIQGVPVSVLHQPGTASALHFSARYPDPSTPGAPQSLVPTPYQQAPLTIRPMAIQLRPETEEDRKAKQQGVVLEFQTGDAPFDQEVFIDTISPAPTIAHVLASPALRAAVRVLFAEGFSRVLIDDENGCITAYFSAFPTMHKRPGQASRMLEAFVNIARYAPYVQRSAEKHPTDTQLVWLIAGTAMAGVMLFIGPLPYFVLSDTLCNDASPIARPPFSYMGGCHAPVPLGIVVGSLLGVLWGKVISGKIRGRSNSAGRSAWTFVVVVALGIGWTIILFCAVLWSL